MALLFSFFLLLAAAFFYFLPVFVAVSNTLLRSQSVFSQAPQIVIYNNVGSNATMIWDVFCPAGSAAKRAAMDLSQRLQT
jgi:hypothetical protein